MDEIVLFVTVTEAEAEKSWYVPVMIVDPAFTAVSEPLLSIVATDGLLEFQDAEALTFCVVESVSVAVATKFCVAPFGSDTEVGRIATAFATALVIDPPNVPVI